MATSRDFDRRDFSGKKGKSDNPGRTRKSNQSKSTSKKKVGSKSASPSTPRKRSPGKSAGTSEFAPIKVRKKYTGTDSFVVPIKVENIVHRPKTVSIDQWELPIGIKSNGEYKFLADMVGKDSAKFSLASLSGSQMKKLVLKRIQDNPNYPTRQMLGVGTVDKKKAIEEVQADTPAGKFIAESEQRVIQKMIKKLNENNNG